MLVTHVGDCLPKLKLIHVFCWLPSHSVVLPAQGHTTGNEQPVAFLLIPVTCPSIQDNLCVKKKEKKKAQPPNVMCMRLIACVRLSSSLAHPSPLLHPHPSHHSVTMSTKPGLALQRAALGSCRLEVTALKDGGRSRKGKIDWKKINDSCVWEQNKRGLNGFGLKLRLKKKKKENTQSYRCSRFALSQSEHSSHSHHNVSNLSKWKGRENRAVLQNKTWCHSTD